MEEKNDVAAEKEADDVAKQTDAAVNTKTSTWESS